MRYGDIFKRKVYYDEVVKYYIKRGIHASCTTKDMIFITKNGKKKKVSYAVRNILFYTDYEEELLINEIRKRCIQVRFIKNEDLVTRIKEVLK